MDRPSDPGEHLDDDLDQERIKFLGLDLDMCFTLADLAERSLETGEALTRQLPMPRKAIER